MNVGTAAAIACSLKKTTFRASKNTEKRLALKVPHSSCVLCVVAHSPTFPPSWGSLCRNGIITKCTSCYESWVPPQEWIYGSAVSNELHLPSQMEMTFRVPVSAWKQKQCTMRFLWRMSAPSLYFVTRGVSLPAFPQNPCGMPLFSLAQKS